MVRISIFIILSLLSNVIFGQHFNRTIGNGDYDGVIVSTSDVANQNDGVKTLDGMGRLPNLSSTSRFLGQATLGADLNLIHDTAEKGFRRWLDEQMELPVAFSLLENSKNYIRDYRALLNEASEDTTIADGNESYWVRNYFLFSWWKYVMDAEDLLRARVAFALSEILVVSAYPDLESQPLGLASYYDVLIRNAFGNYRDLLEEVTFHPIMARYLTYLNNRKTNPDKNRFPDENYAREIMQLFTIGLYQLNADGTYQLDNDGNPLPTYEQEHIKELAKVFTGLSYGDREEFGHSGSLVKYYSCTIPLKMFNEEHEPGEKYLFNQLVIPDRNPVDGIADIQDALDALFNHQNVGPFLARRLIQRLVTSNPSPAYVERVASAFNDNGSGEKGDMKAVVKAILLDEEARSCTNGYYSGKLKEPVHRHVQLLRSFNAGSPSGEYRYTIRESYLEATDQRVLYSPSVFNFYLPDYQPVGEIANAGQFAPEFQIVHSATLMGYSNAVIKWTFDNNLVGTTRLYPDEPVTDEEAKVELVLEDEINLLANGKHDEVIERLNLVLTHGQMSAETRNIIKNTWNELEGEEPLFQLNMALFLVMNSPEYLVIN